MTRKSIKSNYFRLCLKPFKPSSNRRIQTTSVFSSLTYASWTILASPDSRYSHPRRVTRRRFPPSQSRPLPAKGVGNSRSTDYGHLVQRVAARIHLGGPTIHTKTSMYAHAYRAILFDHTPSRLMFPDDGFSRTVFNV